MMFFKTLLVAALCFDLGSAADATLPVSEWKVPSHTPCGSTYQFSAEHTDAMSAGTTATTSIAYTVPESKIGGAAFVTAPTLATHYKWGTGTTKDLACTDADGATSADSFVMAYASGVFTIHTVAVLANGFSCLQLLNVCVKDILAHGTADNKVKQGTTAEVPTAAGTAAFGTALTGGVITFTPAQPVTASKTDTVSITFTSPTDCAIGSYFTLWVPGLLQYTGGKCWFGDGTTKTTGLAADSSTTGYITFVAVSASTTSATTVTCDKVGYAANQAADTAGILWGSSAVLTTSAKIGIVTLVVAAAVPTAAPFSAAPASAGGSMAALVLGSFAALCLLF